MKTHLSLTVRYWRMFVGITLFTFSLQGLFTLNAYGRNPLGDPSQPTVTTTTSQICSGSSVTLNITGTLNDATSWELYAGGCGSGTSIASTAGSSITLSNVTTTTTYYVRGEGTTLTSPGACGSITITVNATPNVAQPVSQALCLGTSTSAITFSGSVAGTTYDWANNTTSIGLAASGTGNIASFVPTNTSNASVTATVTVTPRYAVSGTQTFSYGGALQTWTVPAGVTSITVDAKGASGGGPLGGKGGRIQSTLTVTPGQQLNIYVGQQGQTYSTATSFNGGGAGGAQLYSGNGNSGGGATDIRIGGTVYSNRVLVAGGGGGSGKDYQYTYYGTYYDVQGGAGGASIGQDGANSQSGKGGNQSSGGNAGTGSAGTGTGRSNSSGTSGVLGVGGNGAGADIPGGGGGGGYYGGGGGGGATNTYTYKASVTGGGGGGGSNYSSGTIIANTQGDNTGDGSLTISYTVLPICYGNAKTFDITVNPKPVAYSVTGGGSFCSGGTGVSIGLSNSQSGVNYQLKNGANNAGLPVAGTGAAMPNAFPNQTAVGTYSVVGIHTSGNCTTTMSGTATIAINPSPSAPSITATNSSCHAGCTVSGGSFTVTSSCSGGTLTYYNDNQGTSPTTTAPTYNQTAAMTIYYACVNNGTNCRSAIQSLTTSPGVCTPPSVAAITGNTTICNNASTQLSNATSGGTWSSNNTTFATVSTTGLVNAMTAGNPIISYTVTNANGCTGTAYAPVTVNALPADPSNPTSNSPGCGSVLLMYSGTSYKGVSTYWQGSNANGISTQSPAFAAYTVTASGTYYVRAVDDYTSCWSTGSSSAAVIVNPLPAATATAVAPVCPGGNDGSIAFSTPTAGSPAFTYSINGGTSYQSGNAFSTLSAGNGYSAIVKDGNNCRSAAQPVTVPAGVDNIAPVLNCPTTAQSVNVAPGTCAGNYTIADYISDNCTGTTWGATFSGNPNGNPTAISGIADGSSSSPVSFQRGVTTVTLNGVDGSNNAAFSCAFSVTVVDNEKPSITAPGPVTVNGYCAPGAPASAVTLGNPATSDNCASAATLNANTSNDAPQTFPVGTTVVKWTVNDGNGNSSTADQTVTVVPGAVTASVAVSPLYPMSGQEIQTIYLGYPSTAQSEALTVSPSGGIGNYTYSWTRSGGCLATSNLSNNAATYNYTPAAADACSNNLDNVYTFSVLVTDNNGCTATASKKVNVVNPYVSTGDVQICHKVAVRGGSTTQLLIVAPSQVSTYLSHGDYLGNCAIFTGVRSIASAEAEAQQVAVYPNPTTGVFILELSSINTEASIMITDVAGKLIAQKTIAKGTVPTATFDLGSLARGMYLIQVRDGDLNYRTKIVVQ